MAEDVYNIYLVMENDVCRLARYVVHSLAFDTDDEAVAFLKERVESDLADSEVFPLSPPVNLPGRSITLSFA